MIQKDYNNELEEKIINKTNGGIALIVLLAGIVLSCVLFVLGIMNADRIALVVTFFVLSVILLTVTCICFAGLKIIHPNEAAVYTVFGTYYGTIKNAGFYFIHPFAIAYNPSKESTLSAQVTKTLAGATKEHEEQSFSSPSKKVSTKTMTLNNSTQKVNDALGNPIIIGAAVIWKVVNPTKAVFNVDNYQKFLSTQCDSIIRNNARLYPYDTMEVDSDEKTLRGSSQEIAESMRTELQERVVEAGIEIKEVRITHLAYSDEIAAAMLQRQQAVAIIAARQKIVEGAVSMVKMAIDQLGEEKIVVLDEERKAAMVSNLLVVLCGNKDAQPIVNSGSIY